MEDFIKSIKEAFEHLYGLCDDLEKEGLDTRKYIPDNSLSEICELSLQLYFLHLMAADGVFKEEERLGFNLIFERDDSIANLKELAEKSGAKSEDFSKQIPVAFRPLIDLDNLRAMDVNVSNLLYQLYGILGAFIILSDDELDEVEYDRFMQMLKTIYNYITSNLTYDLPDLLPPSTLVRQELSRFKYPENKINEMSKRNRKKNDTKNSKGNVEKDDTDADEEVEEETLEELLNQLNDLVGLNQVKYEVTSLINLCRVKQIREANGLQFPNLSLHMVFSGNPGTGKTTVARLVSKIYKKIGVLSKGHLVEVDRSGLVGGYVGQTALKVTDVISEAVGGVLFVDEAYALTSTGISNDYGSEAVDTLVKAMEDHRDDLIVIVAGYPEPMEKFVNSNPGLKSRFNKFIHFEDYSADELVKVFSLFCKKAGYRASLDALKYVKETFEERIASKPENFANAREVRNLFEQGMMRQANRIVMVSDIKPETLTLLKKEDLSGETDDFGKSEQLAKIAMRGLSKGTRMGLPAEIMSCPLDELELTQRATNALSESGIATLGQIMDYLESGKKLSDLENMNEQIANGVLEKLTDYGYNFQ